MEQFGLYIHIPFCIKKCDYCDFLSFAADNRTQDAYTHALVQEITYMGKKYGGTPITSIYIGGGTPSWLDEKNIAAIMEAACASFFVTDTAEITIECNPGTVTASKMRLFASLGINRISIGLQSANEEELKLLGRIHTYDQFLHIFELARKTGFYNINVDLMTGLPFQNQKKLLHTLDEITLLRPEHISAYSLMIEEGTPFYEKYKFDAVKQHAGMPTEELPSEDEEYAMTKMTQQYLEEHGYHAYEVSNFAREGHVCEHNILYWTRKPYLGVGLGAASLLGHTRISNIRDIFSYIKVCENLTEETEEQLRESVQPLSKKEEMEEFMYLGLRMRDGVSRADFYDCFGISVEAIYARVIRELESEELLVQREGRIYLTDRGQDVSNYALAKFLL